MQKIKINNDFCMELKNIAFNTFVTAVSDSGGRISTNST